MSLNGLKSSFLMMVLIIGVYDGLNSSSVIKSADVSQALTGKSILTPGEIEDEKTSRAFKEIQAALDEYKDKIAKVCPNSFDLLTDPRFLASTLPDLSSKFLTNPNNAALLNTFAFNIPFLRINDQPIRPEFSDALFQVVKTITAFIELYNSQEKILKFKQIYSDFNEK